MRKIIGTLAATLAIALIAPAAAFANHREAPGVLKDPTADNTDVYAFTAPSSNPSLAFWGDRFMAMAQEWFDAEDWFADWYEDYDEGDSLDADIAGISADLSGTRSLAAEVDISADKAVLVTTEPEGGSPQPTSDPVLAAQIT